VSAARPRIDGAAGLAAALWRLLDGRDRLWLALSPLLSLLMGLATLGGIAAVIPFFAVLGDPAIIHHNLLLSRSYDALGFTTDRGFLVALGAAFVGVLLLANTVSLLGTLLITRFAYRAGERFHAALLAEYLHRDMLFHSRSHGAQLVHTIVYEAKRVASGIVHSALLLATNVVTGGLIIAAVVALNPRIAAAAIAGLGGSYAIAYALVRRRAAAYGQIESAQGDVRMRIVTESLGGIRDLLLSSGQREVLRRFSAACADISRAASGIVTVGLVPRHVIECVTGAGLVATALALTAGGGPAPWLATVSFLGLAAYRLLPALQQAFAAVVRIRADRTVFERLQRDLELGTERLRHPAPTIARGPFEGTPRTELRLESVTFRYSPDLPPALREVSIVIPARHMVGLLGANGSGKTTLADVALGLLAPDAGRVCVDGVALGEASRPAWRAATAYVPQAIFLSDTTVAENIASLPLECIDWSRLRAAGSAARLDEFVDRLPAGYRTPVGERGVRLSGGQRQRIGIARALYRDASMLVLDEATSALDGLAEREVLAALEALRDRATVLIIAHRVEALARCDLVIELADGAVIDQGRFEEVRARSERLRRLADAAAPVRLRG